MPTITFSSFDIEAFETFKPVPANRMQPDWWKKSKVHMVDNGQVTITLRACPAMHDWLSTGYYIATSRDIKCLYTEDSGGTWYVQTEAVEGDDESYKDVSSPTHHRAQLMGDNFSFLQGDGSDSRPHDAFKFRVPWRVETPPGYSALYLDPFLHQNKYFRTWQGLMDTDMFNTMTDNQQVIVYPLVKHDFVIPKNTPIVQVVPYRRENWTASYIHRDFSSLVTEQDDRTSVYGKAPISHHCRREGDVESPDNQIPGGFYRKYMWESKTKDFKDAPKDECPFDPKTGKMKEDFVEIQRKQTDLNWDGSESKKIDRD